MNKSKKHKVLFLIHTLGGGGAEKVLVDTVKQLDNHKFNITVMTVINTGVYIDQLPSHVHYRTMFGKKFRTRASGSVRAGSGSLNAMKLAKTRIFPKIYNFFWKIIPMQLLYRLFISEKYDTEVAFLEGISAKIIAASPNPSSKKLAWVHVDFLNEHKSRAVFWSLKQERKCYNQFDEVICVSKETKHGFLRVIKPSIRVDVIANTIDISPITHALKSYHHKPNSSLIIAVVGRLTHQKGQDRLLRAMQKLTQQGITNYRVQLIGDGHDSDKLKQFVKEQNLLNVDFLGYRTDGYQLMIKADLCFISSRAEGFSTVMTEALLLEKPLITTRVSGTDWLPKQLVIKNTDQAIYQAMKRVITDERYYEDIQKMSYQAKNKLMELNSSAIAQLESALI